MSSLEATLALRMLQPPGCWFRSCHKLEQPQDHYRDCHGQGAPARPLAQVVGRICAIGAIMLALCYRESSIRPRDASFRAALCHLNRPEVLAKTHPALLMGCLAVDRCFFCTTNPLSTLGNVHAGPLLRSEGTLLRGEAALNRAQRQACPQLLKACLVVEI